MRGKRVLGLAARTAAAAAALAALVAPRLAAAQARDPGALDRLVRRLDVELGSRPIAPGAVGGRALAFAQSRTFVAYPGSPGVQTDVFTQNFEALNRDFGVPLSRLVYRDSSGFHARYDGLNRGGSTPRPPGTSIVRDAEYLDGDRHCGLPSRSPAGVAAQEAAFLKKLRDEHGLPLVVICHSAFCETALEAVLATNYARGGTPIVETFFYVQGATAPRSIAPVIERVNAGLERATFAKGGGCALDGPIRASAATLASARAFFVADGGASHNSFAPLGYGRYLGPLQISHADSVVAYPRATRSSPTYRRAFTHALVSIAAE